MPRESLPSGSEFWTRFIAIVSACGTACAVVVACYLILLLRMPMEQMKALGFIVAVLLLPATPLSAWMYRRAVRPVISWLEEEAQADETSLETRRRAFGAVVNLPAQVLSLSFFLFAVPAALAVLGLVFWFDEFKLYHAGLMLVAALSAGGLSSLIEGALLKRWLAGLRGDLTRLVPNPMQRSELTRPVSLLTKLQVVIATCTLVPVILTALVGHTRATLPVESFVQTLQLEEASRALVAYDETGDFDLDSLSSSGVFAALSTSYLVIDHFTGELVAGNPEQLASREIERIVESSDLQGIGQELNAEHLYAWRKTHDEHYAVVVASPRAAIVGDAGNLAAVFLSLLVGCLALALGVGWLVAQDVGGATLLLGAAADRMASGDLRRIDVIESEDEMGTLARAFDAMTSALRDSVGEVADTADGVEQAATSISRVSQDLHSGAQSQGREVKQVVEAMDAVEAQASEIARSSNELRHLASESTSSMLELGASGDQLNQTAGSLSERVEEVLTTVEETVRSVRQVGRETGALVEAAADTSSSMEEMAGAMKHVDETAVETASLSEQVVAASEFGHKKARDAIEGIESIRSATETAQSVILRLGGRAQEIGGILDVIDDVADETNLLALNAAIIAAQAGEHGRAFSVVADEIKELADRVLASTKEISGLIRSVQEESQSAIDAMAAGSRSVAEGVERSSEAGESLEEITRISRDSGLRIREIVQSVQEQTKAAGHVVDLMDRVRTGVQTIQCATTEQERGNERVFDATQSMRDAAQQLHLTTAEQATGIARIRESVSGVKEQMESIDGALQEQAGSCGQVVGFLEEVSSRSIANERAARLVGESTTELTEQAIRLRAGMGRFQRS